MHLTRYFFSDFLAFMSCGVTNIIFYLFLKGIRGGFYGPLRNNFILLLLKIDKKQWEIVLCYQSYWHVSKNSRKISIGNRDIIFCMWSICHWFGVFYVSFKKNQKANNTLRSAYQQYTIYSYSVLPN